MASLSLLLFSVLSLRHLPPAGPSPCHRARGAACSSATPAPGADALGWALDVTTLSPTGARVLEPRRVPTGPVASCLLCRDALAGGRWRRVPPAAGGWLSGRRCHQGARVAEGATALGTLVAGLEEAARGWRVGLQVAPGRAVAAGSHSRVAEFALERQREDRFAFAALRLQCLLYWTWVSPHARPSPHFLRALRALPASFTPATAPDYGELLARYGTHYVAAARLGGRLRAVTAIRSCRAAMAGAGAREVADCLGAEVSAGGGAWRAGATAEACRRARAANLANASFNEFFGERLVEVDGGRQDGDLLYGRPEARARWLRSLAAAPALVEADVRPLHALLPLDHPRRRALRAAVAHYISWRALRLNASRHLGWDASRRCSRRRGAARLAVTVKSGAGWRGDTVSATDAYVTVAFGGRRLARTPTAWNRDRPRWDARLDLGVVELTAGARLRLEVWDEDNGWDDDLLGACEEPVEAGAERGAVCFAAGGRLDFSYRAQCGPALGGPVCHDYVPQPPGGDGGVSRFSRWPPGPDEWPRGEEEEEEDDGGAEEPGGSWGALEATDAFGDLPEPLGDVEEGGAAP